MSGAPWNESEVKATIRAYFDLLDSQLAGKPAIKTAIYKRLAEKFPARSAKSFELKFQNISAILYEEGLPYADGLKPRFNYQLLLKLLVLSHLERTSRPIISPIDLLVHKMKLLHKRGFLPVTGNGAGRYGLTLEEQLGIPPNSLKAPDFMGIELKTKHDKSKQTLFSKVPTQFLDCADKRDFIEKFGYWDAKKGRQSLYTSISRAGDSLGFSLKGTNDYIHVVRNGKRVLAYDCDILEEALLSKHSETAYIPVTSKRDRRSGAMCRFDSLTYCKQPSMRRFLKLLNAGKVYLDPLLAIKNGRILDNGFLWKVLPDAVPDIYLHTEHFDLSN